MFLNNWSISFSKKLKPPDITVSLKDEDNGFVKIYGKNENVIFL